ncbi:MAG: MFS transporter [Clostridia bacterium]|nr:MFS transporter [Clostridia bacterium]
MGFSLEPHQAAYEDVARDYTASVMESAPEDATQLAAYEDLGAALEKAVREDKADTLDGIAEDERYAVLSQAQRESVLTAARQLNAQHRGEIENLQRAVSFSTILFWAMAIMVGTVQGGIQAVSRSYFGKLIPKDRSNEFFGFFDIFGKFASVLGPFLYSLIGTWTGRSSFGVLALIALFLVGLVIMIAGKKDLEALDRA